MHPVSEWICSKSSRNFLISKDREVEFILLKRILCPNFLCCCCCCRLGRKQQRPPLAALLAKGVGKGNVVAAHTEQSSSVRCSCCRVILVTLMVQMSSMCLPGTSIEEIPCPQIECSLNLVRKRKKKQTNKFHQ